MKNRSILKKTIYAIFCMVLLMVQGVCAQASQSQTITIESDGQVVDEFCNVKAYYITKTSNTGEYSCAGYVKRFYAAIYNVCVSQINTYAGPPLVAAVGANVSLRQVSTPQPGDIMQNIARTHVAIVKEVGQNQVTLIEQNWKWTSGGKVYAKINRTIDMSDAYFYRLVINGNDAAPAVNATEPSDKKVWQVSATGGINLRKSATTSSDSLLTIPYNTILNVVKEKNKDGKAWGKTTYNGKTGWIMLENAMYVWGQYQAKDVTPPVISNISITNVKRNSYTVTCKVTDDVEIDRVQFPTWTQANGQDDLLADWSTNKKCSGVINGNTVTFVVKRSEHNKEFGIYNTHIYAYDKSGNWQGEVTVGAELGNVKLKSSYVYIQNIKSGKYVTSAKNYPLMKNFRNDKTQLFKLKRGSDGYYTITSVSNKKRLSIKKSKTETMVRFVNASGKDEEYWKIYGFSDRYVFRNKTGYEIIMIKDDSLKSGSKLNMNMQKDSKTSMFRIIY